MSCKYTLSINCFKIRNRGMKWRRCHIFHGHMFSDRCLGGKRPGLSIPDLGPLSPRQGRDRCHYDLKRLVSAPLPPDYSDIIDEWTLAVSNLK